MSEALNCPFCGSDAIALSYVCQPATSFMVSCSGCGCDGPSSSMSEAVTAWNRRTPQPVTPAGGEVEPVAETTGTPYGVGVRFFPVFDTLPEGTKLYTHPPVADAALARDAERYRFLRNDALYYAYASSGLRPMPWCAIGMDKRNFRLAEKEDLDAYIDAALNQRGGG